jgi:group I intron endonuclease
MFIKNLFYNLDNSDLTLITLMLGILPIKIYDNLTNYKNFRSDLHRVGGVYGIVNTSNPKKLKQYIGSSKDLYQRVVNHLKRQNSNSRLQRSIAKYGIESFKIYIYYFHLDPLVILTDIETEIIKSFPFDSLYNFKKDANSMLGYKHTIRAINKMKLRYKDKTNHPMFGKNHDSFALSKISKPGKLNPMFGKSHSIETKIKMSLSKSKVPVGL